MATVRLNVWGDDVEVDLFEKWVSDIKSPVYNEILKDCFNKWKEDVDISDLKDYLAKVSNMFPNTVFVYEFVSIGEIGQITAYRGTVC